MFLSKQRQSRFKVIHIMRSLSLATLSRKKGGVTLSKSSCRTTLSLLWENYSSGSRTPPEKKDCTSKHQVSFKLQQYHRPTLCFQAGHLYVS